MSCVFFFSVGGQSWREQQHGITMVGWCSERTKLIYNNYHDVIPLWLTLFHCLGQRCESQPFFAQRIFFVLLGHMTENSTFLLPVEMAVFILLTSDIVIKGHCVRL